MADARKMIGFVRRELRQSVLVSLWFMFLTFPIMVIKVDTLEKTIIWRWHNMIFVGVGAFALSFVWRALLKRRNNRKSDVDLWQHKISELVNSDPRILWGTLGSLLIAAVVFPFFASSYSIGIMATALSWVMLGLGLNIVVGLAGLLDLGYVAFYAVGAYSYALLNMHFGISFWLALPIGALLAAMFGILLGIPVLRLRGDYLAIVTLGFGEIIRLVLQNWNDFSRGPSGISGIDRPDLFGMKLSLHQHAILIYLIVLLLVIFTIFVVNRLRNSRIGRAWIALREDEIACQAMGIDRMRTKLTAFALGATWAGMAGVVFAGRVTFINPDSFTFWESALILSIVVLGGMGSIVGVILAAFILVLLPEYFRAFSEYRMLVFGACMVLMMVFRPQGLIAKVQRHYQFKKLESES